MRTPVTVDTEGFNIFRQDEMKINMTDSEQNFRNKGRVI